MLLLSVLAVLLLAPVAWAYNAELARGYAKLFEPVHGMQAGKALHMITPEGLVGRSRYVEKCLVTRFNTKCNLTLSHRGII